MSTLVLQIRDVVGENVNLCYQCERCTGGCPVSMEMESIQKSWDFTGSLSMLRR
ncbi:MAG: hypothetical protein GTO45_17965 [Candidatus Aminicenantes bacterium]|nr:hypothetical protein [Candidatus Aminicenantes bacterium]NIM80670.1 hypothetical protein [Candidatus Aminicenantes bacterium]NIN20047.1 hypothetical protein [Candidatus Aminicenantes bacterium]NIN86645.1 hypothetical protein [Candidatus Aminicenantes bacterium]NIO82890.1 hypothetical protein [Candidatus Aminicenantes bacterium]